VFISVIGRMVGCRHTKRRPTNRSRQVLAGPVPARAPVSPVCRARNNSADATKLSASSARTDGTERTLKSTAATPGAMIYFINGLQWAGYKRFDWSVVGESACADSWGRALKTRTPSLSIPCFAERRYGGVLDDEMLMALPPDYLPKAIAGMEALAKNGLRYPFPQYGIQQDVRAGMAVSYPGRGA